MRQNSDRKKLPRFVKLIMVCTALIVAISIGYTAFFLDEVSVSESTTSAIKPEPEEKLNVLVIGVANGLSDTLMLCSYDPNFSKLDVVSIPRDTYYPREGYKYPAQKKINSVYGSEGEDGTVRSVEGLTGVDINYYVKIDYKAVEAIVDAIGGIPVSVPYNMNYDDPADSLHIHFKKGETVEKGSDIVKVLRWRKNNHGAGGYSEGDLGRLETQHEVIRLGMEKLLNGNAALNFIKIQKPILDYVKTNMPPEKLLYYMAKSHSIKSDSISIETLPGTPEELEGLSFFMADKTKMEEMLKDFKI